MGGQPGGSSGHQPLGGSCGCVCVHTTPQVELYHMMCVIPLSQPVCSRVSLLCHSLCAHVCHSSVTACVPTCVTPLSQPVCPRVSLLCHSLCAHVCHSSVTACVLTCVTPLSQPVCSRVSLLCHSLCAHEASVVCACSLSVKCSGSGTSGSGSSSSADRPSVLSELPVPLQHCKWAGLSHPNCDLSTSLLSTALTCSDTFTFPW